MLVITVDGEVEEGSLEWRLWREDAGASWTVVHELRDASGRVVRRDSWVIFKSSPLPVASVDKGSF